MKITERQLERKINRAKQKLKYFEDKKERLSKYGYWDMGYLEGQISVLEDWLDEMNEANALKAKM